MRRYGFSFFFEIVFNNIRWSKYLMYKKYVTPCKHLCVSKVSSFNLHNTREIPLINGNILHLSISNILLENPIARDIKLNYVPNLELSLWRDYRILSTAYKMPASNLKQSHTSFVKHFHHNMKTTLIFLALVGCALSKNFSIIFIIFL